MKPLAACLFIVFLAPSAPAAERGPVVIDTDIGTGIGDAFALGLALGSYELDVRGVTVVGAPTHDRAMMLCRFLTMTGRRHLSVAEGEAPQPERAITDQSKYHYHPDPIFGRTTRPVKQTAAEFLYQRVKGQPNKVIVIALGPLTNVARLLDKYEDAKKLVRRVVLLEDNVKLDEAAAKRVLASGVPVLVVSSKACKGLVLDEAGVKQVFSPGTPLTRQVEALYQMWDRKGPPLAEALAVAVSFEEKFVTLVEGTGAPSVRAVAAVKGKEFAKWYAGRMASLVAPAKRPVKFVDRGNMPSRVHVAEDYDNDIERFWWMSGKAETRNLPPGSKRACRAVLTHDFDDLLMVSRTMYKAVIFNPVPGPPMGKNTRLSFRYWLKGTDALRVQIYSLTNGYHRHLVVKGVPQGKWASATVDMTQARRPDGTGGPLGENERIDDIQFYVDADAELIIDDVVLYDAAAEGEKRPFPKRIIYAGGFATGTKGKHWLGDFEIVQDDGAFWKAARSVKDEKTGAHWIRLGLKGQRALGEKVRLTFRYRLSGADSMRVELVNTAEGKPVVAELKGAKKGQWASADLAFDAGGMRTANELRFLLPKGAEALIDDVVLYEPGE